MIDDNKYIIVNCFPKQDFLDLGFTFEPLTPDDPNPDYYGWVILDTIKFRWFDPCLNERYHDTSIWAYGYVNDRKVDFSKLYFLNSAKEIKEELLKYTKIPPLREWV